jgi:hypothetical protein
MILIVLALSGCAVPARHYVVGENATLCFDEDLRLASALLRPQTIRRVSPLYTSYSSHGSVTSRLIGATIELGWQAPPARVENAIACHREAIARSELDPPNDPFAVAGEVQVMVAEGDHGNLIVKLVSRNMDEARATLDRASALIGRPSPLATR